VAVDNRFCFTNSGYSWGLVRVPRSRP